MGPQRGDALSALHGAQKRGLDGRCQAVAVGSQTSQAVRPQPTTHPSKTLVVKPSRTLRETCAPRQGGGS